MLEKTGAGVIQLTGLQNEFIRRVEQSHTDILDTFTTLIDSASFSILNPSSISPLLKALQSPPPGPRKDAIASAAARFLSFIAKECSPMFVNHVPGLLVTMSQQKNDKLVEVSLQALAAVCKVDPSVAPKDE
jgi:sister-chromatid-cohesion protein PDS5